MRGPVAKRYARALLELGVEKNKLETLQNQLGEIADIYRESKEFQAIISNPSVSREERRGVVRSLASRGGWDPLIQNFALLLLDKDRFQQVVGISEALGEFVDRHEGKVRATVTTATELKDSQVAVIKGALTRMTGKDVVLETEIDPELIGGVVTRVGSTVYDGSVRTQLETIRESVLEEI